MAQAEGRGERGGGRGLQRLCALALLLAAAPRPAEAAPLPAAPPAQTEQITEYRIKAAFLFNFVKYVRWPRDAFEGERDPILVAVLGADPFGKVLDETLAGRVVGGRPVRVARFKGPDDVGRCHVLFLPRASAGLLAAVLERLAGASVLVVAESEGAAQDGAGLNFYIEQDRVRFEMNPDATRRARLDVSSELMKLARRVGDRRGREGGR